MRSLACVAALSTAVALGACGSDDDEDTSASGASTEESAAASKARAEAAIEGFTGKPSAFPVTQPLAERPDSSTKLVFMDCGTPICAIFRQIVGPATEAMGAELVVVKTGQSADSISQAFDSAVQQEPDGMMVTGLDPTIWQGAVKDLAAADIPVATTGVVNGEQFGLTTAPNINVFGKDSSAQTGKLQADWVYARYGDKANVQFNYVPELPFTLIVRDAFLKEFKALCPSCEVRDVKIQISSIGNKAPQDIVSDLQANVDTNVVVAAVSETIVGLPAALKVAGLSVAEEGQTPEAGKSIATVGASGSPQTLQYLRDGQQTIDLATDLPVLSWTLVDAAVRGKVGPRDEEQAKGFPVKQFLGKADITFDPAKGWTGYPDFAERFTELWSGESAN